MTARVFLTATIAALGLAACSEQAEPDAVGDVLSSDPLMARALADPLMVDPDLAYRNEANAAVTVRHDHPLPPLVATDELAILARDAARVELLNDGPIPDPTFPTGEAAPAVAKLSYAGEIVAALNGPADCAASLESGLIWAADMPTTASIMPHGMVQQAAGVSNGECTMRVVRYLTPVGVDDAIGYHFARADRARLRPTVFENPESAVIGDGRTEFLAAYVREGPGGMSAVDLVYWAK